jgi:hypothetical protein
MFNMQRRTLRNAGTQYYWAGRLVSVNADRIPFKLSDTQDLGGEIFVEGRVKFPKFARKFVSFRSRGIHSGPPLRCQKVRKESFLLFELSGVPNPRYCVRIRYYVESDSKSPHGKPIIHDSASPETPIGVSDNQSQASDLPKTLC